MNAPARRVALASIVVLAIAVIVAPPAQAQCVSLTTMGSASTQNFDTLSNTAGSTTNNLTITGWFMTESGGGARDNEQYAVDTGGSNTGDTYSYGAAGATDRALGGLRSGTLIPIYGACFTNNTGSTITSLGVAYTGEEWRLGTAARTDQINFEYSLNATDLVTGAWTGVAALNFVTPVTATTGAKDGNAAANRTALSSTVSSLSIANGATFWIRWTDTDASGADDGLAVDDFSLTPQVGPVTPNLTINDVAAAETNAGTTTFAFTVSLSAPAGAGGVTFDIATADGTAQDDTPATEDNDYVAQSLTGQTIAAGSSTYTFNVTVNGDPTTEPNETFFVNVTNVTGATVTDGQGQGTINNDDVTLTPIHDIQGPGASSPIVGASVTTRGVVTGVRSQGFYIQEPDASVDADPATSEGIYVFTNAAPPAAAAVGNLVQVTGTVAEYVPSADPLQPPLTELTGPTVLQLSTGNPLPAAIPLTATFPDPAGPYDQLERVEGMRVGIGSMTVVAPTLGSVNEPNATATSTGVFYGVVTGVPRPFREAGIRAPDPAPAGTIPPIPRWDNNPEVISVDSDGLTGTTLVNVATGAVVPNVTGPLDYTFRAYRILPETTLVPAGGMTATAATLPTASEFTVASYNLERFFDNVNDPAIGEPVLTTTAFNARLAKASLHIRTYLNTPDVLGVIEVENLTTLQALATQINTDAGPSNPQYVPHLVEGNDVGGIDVGFLVKTAPVVGTTPRVTVNAVVQELDGTLFANPDASTETLNDRPPLRLDAVINHANGASFPVTVIVNHLRSLNGVDDTTAGSNGWTTAGDRVRAKRLAQAADLANLVQARQTATPAERIVVVGDFNAFDVNDGFVHSMATIAGTPVPDNETVVPGDTADLVNPDLVNLVNTPPAGERYGYVFDGSAQNIDHILVNDDVVSGTIARRIEHPRVNADFPATDRNGTTTRLSDHEPVVGFFQVAAFASAGITTTVTDAPDPVFPGLGLTYTITVTNGGPDAATGLSLTDTIPAGTTFASLTAAGGWACTTPAFGATGTVNCTVATLAAATNAVFTLNVTVDAAAVPGSVVTNTAAVAQTSTEGTPGDESATTTTTVQTPPAVYATKSVTGPAYPGGPLTWTITLVNNGSTAQLDNPGDELVDVLPAAVTLVSASASSGTAVATVATNTVTWNGSVPAGSSVTVTILTQVGAAATIGQAITNQATLSYDADGNGTNEASAVTDDPGTGTVGDGTTILVTLGAGGLAVVPALDVVGLGLLAALLALGGVLLIGRRLS